jgi:SAM-dependent methyltransferase
MSVCSDVADYEWLTGSDAAELLGQLAAGRAPLLAVLERLRAHLSPTQTHLLVEQLELRRRAVAKFEHAERMFFTRTGLEQATDQWVARYKAARLAGQPAEPASPRVSESQTAPRRIADLCCGVGGDLLALAQQADVIGVDRSPVAAHFARANADAVLRDNSADRIAVLTADVEQFDLKAAAAWHIDPDRRAAGRRTTSLYSCQPNLAMIERLLAEVPHAAIKLAPATRVPADWLERCELEWISRGGECRQLVAWHGDLAHAAGRCRATIVSPLAAEVKISSTNCGFAARTIVGLPNQPLPIVDRLDQYIFDVDPAVLAAHLKGALADELCLAALGAGSTYLTGSSPLRDAAVACFRIDEVLPMRVRPLARHLRDRGIGRLEIKKRGLDIEPEKLRRELRLRGENEAVLLITPVAGRPTAILAHRVL